MIRLQQCEDCGALQYPPREVCTTCLSDRLFWQQADAMGARVLATTLLHHSNEKAFRDRLPLRLALVKFDTGPVALCFLASTATPGDAVQVRLNSDNLLEAA